jgi:hypothetical protein
MGTIMKTTTTIALLAAVKAKHGGISDYKLASVLGVTRQQVSLYRTGKCYMSDEVGATIAAELDYPLLAVLAALAEERAKTPAMRDAWRDAVQRFGGIAAAVLVGIGLAGAPEPSQAGFNNNQMGAQTGQSTHMRTIRRRRHNLVATLASSAALTLSALGRYARVHLAMMAL